MYRGRQTNKRIHESECTGPVYWPNHTGSYGDGYFADIEEVRDYCARRDVPLPVEVESCSATPLSLNADEILDAACEGDHYEDIRDAVPMAAWEALVAFVDEWNARADMRPVCSWNGNGDVVVLEVGK